jgi:hypothetical protein
MYELIKNEFGSFVKKVNENGSISHIPINEANSDYQRYLEDEAKTK